MKIEKLNSNRPFEDSWIITANREELFRKAEYMVLNEITFMVAKDYVEKHGEELKALISKEKVAERVMEMLEVKVKIEETEWADIN